MDDSTNNNAVAALLQYEHMMRALRPARQALERHWPMAVLVSAGVLALLNIAAFWPGFMSNDSIQQLAEARRDAPLQDWHPPVMAALWRVLMHLAGGQVGAMLVWQVLLLWLGLALAAIYVYKQTGRRGMSVLPLALGLMPFVLNISGVIWKDVQMAVALLLAAVLLLFAGKVEGWQKNLVLVLSGLSIIYAFNMRYNALAAAVPLLWLMWRAIPNTKARHGAVTITVVGALLVVPVLALVRPIAQTHPVSSMMLDDIVHLYDASQIERQPVSTATRQVLTAVRTCNEVKHIPVSVLVACVSPQQLDSVRRERYQETVTVWRHALADHPAQYAGYRLSQYWLFLTPRSPAEAYVWHDGIVFNQYGLIFHPSRLSGFVKGYVQLASLDFGFIFRPYVWLLVGSALVYSAYRQRKGTHATYIAAFAASGVLYILSYIPAVPAYDFRYSYWSCLSISLALLLALVDRYNAKHEA